MVIHFRSVVNLNLTFKRQGNPCGRFKRKESFVIPKSLLSSCREWCLEKLAHISKLIFLVHTYCTLSSWKHRDQDLLWMSLRYADGTAQSKTSWKKGNKERDARMTLLRAMFSSLLWRLSHYVSLGETSDF